MKNKIILIITISIFTYHNTFVAWACLIKDKSAPALLEYIENNRIVIKNITNEIVKSKNSAEQKKLSWYSKWKKDTAEDFNNKAEETSSIFNEIFNFRWYYSYFNYYVIYPIFNEIPYQVKRDYRLLDNEWKWMTNYLKQINKNWSSNIIIKNPCKWITKWLDKCETQLNNKRSIDILWKLIKNNDKILDMYRNSVMWNDDDYDIDNFILVEKDFIDQIQLKYYSQIAVSECNNEEWGFFKQISQAIKDIKLINKEWEDWIKKWQDAFALLIWNKPDEENKIEQQKLKEYLNDNWIPFDKQAIIMKNLKETNSNWFSVNNNFITYSFNATKKKLKKDIALWKKQYIWDAIPKNTKKIAINEIWKITDNSDITRNIKVNIDNLYESELPFIWVWNVSSETLRAKIISSHFNIQDSIKVLEETLKISTKVCNSQWWWWKCD